MDTKSALNEVNKLHLMFRGVQNLKETLEHVEGLDQHEKEITSRIDKLKSEEARLQARKDELLDEAVKKRDQAAEVLLNAQAQAFKTEADAVAKAKGIVETAEEKQSRIEALAAQADEKLRLILDDVHNKTVELDALVTAIAKHKAEARKLAGD